ncbi:MAG: type II toxin-antitoxin system HicB family antitoxin [Dongiaceae bacterium]
MQYYAALIHKEPYSDYGVMFPDLPGCITSGITYEEAVCLAADALSGHVAILRECGDAIPSPRTLEQIRRAKADWVSLDGALIAMVPLLPVETKAKSFSISMDSALIAAIDVYAEGRGTTRSHALAAAARLLLSLDPIPAKSPTDLVAIGAATPPRTRRANLPILLSRPRKKLR